jgi:AhpD family alkylhydroperoxidase
MHERLDYATLSPTGVEALRSIERHLARTALPKRLIELIKIRVSQLNGCAYCIDMHTKVARAAGESEQRLYALSAWHETPFFSDQERAALAWAEALTDIKGGVPDSLYTETKRHFDDTQLVDLTYAAVAINSWNRIAIAFRKVPGTFQLPARPSNPKQPS